MRDRRRRFARGRSGNPAGRQRGCRFALTAIKSAADIARETGAVTAALAGGLITPAEGQAIAKMVTTFVQTIETSDFDRRLQMLEADQPSSQPAGWPYSNQTTLRGVPAADPLQVQRAVMDETNQKLQDARAAIRLPTGLNRSLRPNRRCVLPPERA